MKQGTEIGLKIVLAFILSTKTDLVGIYVDSNELIDVK
jgi:hypothetical protein